MGRRKRSGTVRRSGLEDKFEAELQKRGVEYRYEPFNLDYIVPETKRKYKPDFVVEKEKIIFETKGRLTSDDRKKMLLVKEQHPEYRIIMVFGKPFNTLSKKSKTRYSDWCDKNGIEWEDIEEIEKGKQICQSSITQKTKASPLRTRRTKRSKRSSTSRVAKSRKRSASKSRTRS